MATSVYTDDEMHTMTFVSTEGMPSGAPASGVGAAACLLGTGRTADGARRALSPSARSPA
eukprot:2564778-Pleurochrysis_carterae.AAC.1